jgi:hypothetical protein
MRSKSRLSRDAEAFFLPSFHAFAARVRHAVSPPSPKALLNKSLSFGEAVSWGNRSRTTMRKPS